MLLHCEWATHELRQLKRDRQNCLVTFVPIQLESVWLLPNSSKGDLVPQQCPLTPLPILFSVILSEHFIVLDLACTVLMQWFTHETA